MHLIRRILERARDERGNTMATVMGVMLVGGLLAAAAIASPTKDVGLSRFDQDYKDALAAAEAGVADYMYHLNRDNAYWLKCTDVASPNAVNQEYPVSGTTRWRTVPGTTNTYSIELLPATGSLSCVKNQAASMIDDTGMFRIRVTGRARNAKRTIAVTFKRRSFLDYLYFTDLETTDPVWYEVNAYGRPTTPNIVAWASENCAKTYWRQGRGNLRYTGKINRFDGKDYDYNLVGDDACGEIQFAPGDVIAGPLHTNDEILTCGSPTFGRSPQDRVEVSGQGPPGAPTPGWRTSCGGSPNFVGTWAPNSGVLTLPPSNSALKKVVEQPAYLFTGATALRFSDSNVRVTNAAKGLNNVNMAIPPNGVIFVQNGVCGQGYQPLNPYGNAPGCADVRVSGTYSSDVTIASEKDIIIDGDVKRSGDAMAGLIANNFIRIYHPVKNRNPNYPWDCDNDPVGTMTNVQVDAALLALQHSVTVDNYYCGAPLGNLAINGAIAQKFRGPVGMGGSGGTPVHGYTKRYSYDDRLRFRSPPNFLDPVQTAWRIARHTEQSPASKIPAGP